MDITAVTELKDMLHAQVHKVVVGQEEVLDLVLTALLAEGHVLLEGVPGTAKTLLVKTLASSLDLAFKRIQFTPDLMPGDVTGTNLFNFRTNEFVLTKGPIFTELLLADEINRTPPKTQAALLQAMQERRVTIDGTTHDLGQGFMVVATQNPIEQEGTYPLPEAQLDRFLFKVKVDYPTLAQERLLVKRHGRRTAMPVLSDFSVAPVADLECITRARKVVSEVELRDELVDYLVAIVRATRCHPSLLCGASPRAASMLAAAARAHAALAGRDFVIPDDIKILAEPALAHRVVLSPTAEIEGLSTEVVLKDIVTQERAPR